MRTIKKVELSFHRETLLELARRSLDHARGGLEAAGDKRRASAPKSWFPGMCEPSNGRQTMCLC
jgi:hypothetical protein